MSLKFVFIDDLEIEIDIKEMPINFRNSVLFINSLREKIKNLFESEDSFTKTAIICFVTMN